MRITVAYGDTIQRERQQIQTIAFRSIAADSPRHIPSGVGPVESGSEGAQHL